MIDDSTEGQMRQLVESAHKRGEVVNVYRLARQIPISQDVCTPQEVVGRISELAVRMGANVCWERRASEPGET